VERRGRIGLERLTEKIMKISPTSLGRRGENAWSDVQSKRGIKETEAQALVAEAEKKGAGYF